jgi:hypothetical protein
MKTQLGICVLLCRNIWITDCCGRAVKGVGLRPLACWDLGFASRRVYGCSSVVFVGYCVGSGLCDEPINRREDSYRLYVCLIACNLEICRMTPTRPDFGCCNKETKSIYRLRLYISVILNLTPDNCKLRFVIVMTLTKQLWFSVEHHCSIWCARFGTTLTDDSTHLYLGFLPLFIRFECVEYFSVRIWLLDAVSLNVKESFLHLNADGCYIHNRSRVKWD